MCVCTFSPGDVTAQFTAAPSTCPNDTFIFECNVSGSINLFTTWRVTGRRGVDVCALAHTTPDAMAHCGPHFTARPRSGFGTSGPSYSSTLSGTAIPVLNETLVECFGPHISRGTRNRVGSSTLQILGKHAILIYILVYIYQVSPGHVHVHGTPNTSVNVEHYSVLHFSVGQT